MRQGLIFGTFLIGIAEGLRDIGKYIVKLYPKIKKTKLNCGDAKLQDYPSNNSDIEGL